MTGILWGRGEVDNWKIYETKAKTTLLADITTKQSKPRPVASAGYELEEGEPNESISRFY